MSDNSENVNESVHEALSAVLGSEQGSIVTRWVLIAERYGADGKGIEFLCKDEMAPWEIIGLTEMGSTMARLNIEEYVMDGIYATDDEDED